MNLLLIGNYFTEGTNNLNVWQELALKLREAGNSVLTSSTRRGKIPRLLDMLTNIITKADEYQIAGIDVFSGNAFTFAYLCAKLLQAMKKPFFLTLHGGNLPDFAQRHPRAVRSILQNAAAVVAPSGYLQQAMKPYHAEILLIPNALELSRYAYRQRETPAPRLIWLRAFHQIYNPQLAIAALAQLHLEFPDIRLMMVGPDKGDGSLQNAKMFCHEMGLENAVSFPGAVKKAAVPAALNDGDIFLNTTNIDNTPISVMEAMACGLCIVSTNVGGIPWLVRDEQEALLVAADDPAAMAAAVRRLLREPGLAGRLSANARVKAETLDWSIILQQWEKLFTQINNQSHG